MSVTPVDPDLPIPDDRRPSWYYMVTPGYLETMQVPLISGRTFDEHDTSGPPDPNSGVIIDEILARRLWPERNPVGQRLGVGERSSHDPPHARGCSVSGGIIGTEGFSVRKPHGKDCLVLLQCAVSYQEAQHVAFALGQSPAPSGQGSVVVEHDPVPRPEFAGLCPFRCGLVALD